MKKKRGRYTDWTTIDYKPAIADMFSDALLPYLAKGQNILDVGCNKGGNAVFLAKRGYNVVGIDINTEALEIAEKRSGAEGTINNTIFKCIDITNCENFGSFDAVIMIRLLTCIPEFKNWKKALQQAYCCLKENGIIYINDFLLSPESENYRKRYQEGRKLGWRSGNFAVNDDSGALLFIAHHHSDDEVEEIINVYEKIELKYHKSISMNGNECRMFEFIGRKKLKN